MEDPVEVGGRARRRASLMLVAAATAATAAMVVEAAVAPVVQEDRAGVSIRPVPARPSSSPRAISSGPRERAAQVASPLADLPQRRSEWPLG